MDANRAIRSAYCDGIWDRRMNPACGDGDSVLDYFIYEAWQEGVYHTRLYGTLYDANLKLADIAKWGKYYRDQETSFLLK